LPVNQGQGKKETRPRDLASIFLVSAATLAFEVVLTRLFALAFWHHFASLLIALALTGFGAAGSLAAVLPLRRGRPSGPALAATALASAGTMTLAFQAALAVGMEPLSLAWSLWEWPKLLLVCLILIVPFVPAAGHITLVLAWSSRPGAAYAASLAGSGLGCLVSALALAVALPHQALYPAVGLALLGFAVQLKGLSRRWKVRLLAGAVGLASLGWVFAPGLRYEPFKDREVALAAQGSRLLHQKTGLRGVVEVVAGPTFHHLPGLSLSAGAGLPEQAGLFLDGDLRGAVTRLGQDQEPPGILRRTMAFLPHLVLNPKRVLIINPGGGLGLLAALTGGAEQILALEENPQVAELMSGPLSGFNGRIFHRDRVELATADPAAFLARRERRFDLIVLGEGTRWEAGGEGGLGVSRLLTVEGLAGLLAGLEPGGALALTGTLLKPPRAAIKLLATAALALEGLGREPGPGLALIRDWTTVQVLIKPDGFSPRELALIRGATGDLGFDLSWLPGLEAGELNRFHLLPGEPVHAAAKAVLSQARERLFKKAWFDLRPASRDRPYFDSFFRFRTLSLILGPSSRQALAVTQWGLLFTWGGLIAALSAAGAGIFLPLLKLGRRPPGLVFFALLGLGYMLAEITLLQEAIYILGRPALAVPLVVGVFLAASGLGSLLWGARRPEVFCLASGLGLALGFLGLRLLPAGAPWVGLALLPAALVMGAPLAGGLTHLTGGEAQARAWAFGVNGFFSVVGSLLAGLICIQLGHGAALGSAGACYLLALAAAGRGR